MSRSKERNLLRMKRQVERGHWLEKFHPEIFKECPEAAKRFIIHGGDLAQIIRAIDQEVPNDSKRRERSYRRYRLHQEKYDKEMALLKKERKQKEESKIRRLADRAKRMAQRTAGVFMRKGVA